LGLDLLVATDCYRPKPATRSGQFSISATSLESSPVDPAKQATQYAVNQSAGMITDMAFDAYLKIDGIPGEALDAQF